MFSQVINCGLKCGIGFSQIIYCQLQQIETVVSFVNIQFLPGDVANCNMKNCEACNDKTYSELWPDSFFK